MRHYEIVLLIHPDLSEQVPAMLERYKGLAKNEAQLYRGGLANLNTAISGTSATTHRA